MQLQTRGGSGRLPEQDLVEQHSPAGNPPNALGDLPASIARPPAVDHRGSPKRIARRDEIEDEMTTRMQVFVDTAKQRRQPVQLR